MVFTVQVVFRVGIALLASAQEQLCHMPFERLVAALNGRKFPVLTKQPDALMKVCIGPSALRMLVRQSPAVVSWVVCLCMLGSLNTLHVLDGLLQHTPSREVEAVCLLYTLGSTCEKIAGNGLVPTDTGSPRHCPSGH